MVRAVPVFGSGGSSAKKVVSVFENSLTRKDGSSSGFGSWKTVPAVPVRRFRFRFREKRFRGFRFPVLVRFLCHPTFANPRIAFAWFGGGLVSGGAWELLGV